MFTLPRHRIGNVARRPRNTSRAVWPSQHRTFATLQQSYFLGTTGEIVERIRDLEAAGIQDMVLGTCADDLDQLERFASEIVARFPKRS